MGGVMGGEKVPAEVRELADSLGHDFNPAERATAIDAASRKGFQVGFAPNLEQLDAAVHVLFDGKPARGVRKYARAEVLAALTGGPR